MPTTEDVLIQSPGDAATTMPVYTHYQAALPDTFGHYLAGVALALRGGRAQVPAVPPGAFRDSG